MTPKDIHENFLKEFKDLLLKYKAEIIVLDNIDKIQSSHKIVVNFEYNKSFFDEYGSGEIDSLEIGSYENGDI